jgi:hypothetical protein
MNETSRALHAEDDPTQGGRRMLESILILVGVLLFAAVTVFAVFSIGMRRKTP